MIVINVYRELKSFALNGTWRLSLTEIDAIEQMGSSVRKYSAQNSLASILSAVKGVGATVGRLLQEYISSL